MINEEVFKTLIQIFKIKAPDSAIFIEKISKDQKDVITLKINDIVYNCKHIESKTYYKNYNLTEFIFEADNRLYPTYYFRVSHLDQSEAQVYCDVYIHVSDNYDIQLGWDKFENYFKNNDVEYALVNISKSLMYRFASDNTVSKTIRRLEKKGWNLELFDDGLEAQRYSPAGQDFVIQLEGETFEELIKSAKKFYESYDPSKEAMRWIDEKGHGINGAPHDLIDLIQDLIWCKQVTKEFYDEISKESQKKPKAENLNIN